MTFRFLNEVVINDNDDGALMNSLSNALMNFKCDFDNYLLLLIATDFCKNLFTNGCSTA